MKRKEIRKKINQMYSPYIRYRNYANNSRKINYLKNFCYTEVDYIEISNSAHIRMCLFMVDVIIDELLNKYKIQNLHFDDNFFKMLNYIENAFKENDIEFLTTDLWINFLQKYQNNKDAFCVSHICYLQGKTRITISDNNKNECAFLFPLNDTRTNFFGLLRSFDGLYQFKEKEYKEQEYEISIF